MAKGADFERQFSKRLSLWWTHGERDDVFWRTPGSGGRSTVRAKAGVKADVGAGDIVALDPIGQPLLDFVTIELKNGYKEDVLASFVRGKGKLETFVRQAMRQAEMANTYWWLVWKMPVGIEYIIAPREFFKQCVTKDFFSPSATFRFCDEIITVDFLPNFFKQAGAVERIKEWTK